MPLLQLLFTLPLPGLNRGLLVPKREDHRPEALDLFPAPLVPLLVSLSVLLHFVRQLLEVRLEFVALALDVLAVQALLLGLLLHFG